MEQVSSAAKKATDIALGPPRVKYGGGRLWTRSRTGAGPCHAVRGGCGGQALPIACSVRR